MSASDQTLPPQALKPCLPGWTRQDLPAAMVLAMDCAGAVWMKEQITAISTLADTIFPDGSGETGLQWHVSVSRQGRRPAAQDVVRALAAFRFQGAEEDNHHPGNARHFWRPVDPARRVDCECKASEVVIQTGSIQWTNPVDAGTPGGEDCRGCEIAPLTGRDCPLHGDAWKREPGRRTVMELVRVADPRPINPAVAKIMDRPGTLRRFNQVGKTGATSAEFQDTVADMLRRGKV